MRKILIAGVFGVLVSSPAFSMDWKDCAREVQKIENSMEIAEAETMLFTIDFRGYQEYMDGGELHSIVENAETATKELGASIETLIRSLESICKSMME